MNKLFVFILSSRDSPIYARDNNLKRKFQNPLLGPKIEIPPLSSRNERYPKPYHDLVPYKSHRENYNSGHYLDDQSEKISSTRSEPTQRRSRYDEYHEENNIRKQIYMPNNMNFQNRSNSQDNLNIPNDNVYSHNHRSRPSSTPPNDRKKYDRQRSQSPKCNQNYFDNGHYKSKDILYSEENNFVENYSRTKENSITKMDKNSLLSNASGRMKVNDYVNSNNDYENSSGLHRKPLGNANSARGRSPSRSEQTSLFKQRKSKSPISSHELQPKRYKGRNVVLHILETKEVCVETLQKIDGKFYVVEVVKISSDGMKIAVFYPNNRKGVPASEVPTQVLDKEATVYSYNDEIPQKIWKKYETAYTFVNSIKKSTPRVRYYDENDKFILMKNSPPNFEAVFYLGPKLVFSQDKITITEPNKRPYDLVKEECPDSLPSNLKIFYEHAKDVSFLETLVYKTILVYLLDFRFYKYLKILLEH